RSSQPKLRNSRQHLHPLDGPTFHHHLAVHADRLTRLHQSRVTQHQQRATLSPQNRPERSTGSEIHHHLTAAHRPNVGQHLNLPARSGPAPHTPRGRPRQVPASS